MIWSWEKKIDIWRWVEEKVLEKVEDKFKELFKDVKVLMNKVVVSWNLGDYNIVRKIVEEVFKINLKLVLVYNILLEIDLMFCFNSKCVLKWVKSNGVFISSFKDMCFMIEVIVE